ncbi:Ig-like domain-containing protein [Pseudarthrobacter sp. J1738]|uniref:L,D-transpeptidase n=1 Tax=unclassified Pseudarthrobacter TaxID=2647000 RepID=UPI003D2E8E64
MASNSKTSTAARGWKIAGGILACALVAGGVGLVTTGYWPSGGQTPVAGSSQSTAGLQAPSGAGNGSAGAQSSGPSNSHSPSPAPVVKPLELGVTPNDGAQEVNPAIAPAIKVINGTIKSVSLKDSKGSVIVGKLSADAASWSANDPLEFNERYTYEFVVADSAGNETTKRHSFATVQTANEADAAVFPSNGSVMGSGQPVQITFSEPVINKAAVEKAVKISSTSGQPVAWRWYSDKMARIRPQTFWAAGSKVTIDMQLFGVDFGQGMIGNFNSTVGFSVGQQKVAVVDDITKTMKVYFNSALVKTFPVTLGDPEWLSPTGYAVIMEQERYSKFNAGSIGLKKGDKGYYPPLTVEHANRLTSSGVYVHQALPSAYAYVGNTNVSHGCVGLLPADAAWFFNNMTSGDVVQTLNTGAPAVEPLEGWGDWNIPWAQYASR